VRSRTRLQADAGAFYLETRLEGLEGETPVCVRELRAVIPRDLV
jgi:hypothetical protein